MPGRLTYYVAASLDGRIAHADGSYGGLLTEGPHVAAFEHDLRQFDVVVMGRRTYEVGLAAGLPEGAPAYPAMENVVCTRSRHFETQPGLRSCADADAFVRRRKGQGQALWLCGGSSLASSLLESGLVDEVVVKINPALFGSGIGIVSDAAVRTELRLRETRAFDNGVVFLRYDVEGAAR